MISTKALLRPRAEAPPPGLFGTGGHRGWSRGARGPEGRSATGCPCRFVAIMAQDRMGSPRPRRRPMICMATATPELVQALRQTAARLREGSAFAWGHMGCICGPRPDDHRALPRRDPPPRRAPRRLEPAVGGPLPASGLAIDHVIDEMIALGLSNSDIRHLEHLDDSASCAACPPAAAPPGQGPRGPVHGGLRRAPRGRLSPGRARGARRGLGRAERVRRQRRRRVGPAVR